jgi:cytochrome P450
VAIGQAHANADEFPNPERFDPQRFVGERPTVVAWIPFGGGTRRCVGAAFANMEMDVVLRTVLRDFTVDSTAAPDEKWHSRGIAFTPKKGGRVTLRRRA